MFYKKKTHTHTYEGQYYISLSPSTACCGSSVSSVLGLIHFVMKENLNFLFLRIPFTLLGFSDGSFSGMSCWRLVSMGRLLRAYDLRSLNSRLSSAGIWTSPLLCSWALVSYQNFIKTLGSAS